MLKDTEIKIKALASLLDDPDDSIYKEISNQILNLGELGIPYLLKEKENSSDSLKNERIDSLLHKLAYKKFEIDIENWLKNQQNDLLEGCLIIARYGYPLIDEKKIHSFFDSLESNIKQKLKETDSNPISIIKAFNAAILNELHFKGNTEHYTAVDNSFINRVIASKKGNPIMLSIIYIIIAQRLGIPIVGVNSPGHFILAYSKADSLNTATKANSLFYIDPFNGGLIYPVNQVNGTIKKVEDKTHYTFNLDANNNTIIKRVINNLIHSLSEFGGNDQAKHMLTIFKRIV